MFFLDFISIFHFFKNNIQYRYLDTNNIYEKRINMRIGIELYEHKEKEKELIELLKREDIGIMKKFLINLIKKHFDERENSIDENKFWKLEEPFLEINDVERKKLIQLILEKLSEDNSLKHLEISSNLKITLDHKIIYFESKTEKNGFSNITFNDEIIICRFGVFKNGEFAECYAKAYKDKAKNEIILLSINIV